MNDNRKKKVALFVCHDLVGLLMLNGIVPAMLGMGMEPVLFNTTNKRNRKFKVPTPHLVAACNVRALEEVILPFVETMPETGPNLGYRQLAQKHGLQYHEVDDVNAPPFIAQVVNDDALIGALSVRFLQVFGRPVIEAFNNKGFMWNLHSGLLEKYKGLLLPYRAIENGEKEYGLTLHETVPGIDEGGIIDLGALPLDPSRPVLDLYLDTVDTGIAMVTKAFAQLQRGTAPRITPQKPSGPETYYSNPTAEEFLKFIQRGIFYADSVLTVHRIADAFAPAGTAANDSLRLALNGFLTGNQVALPFRADPVRGVA